MALRVSTRIKKKGKGKKGRRVERERIDGGRPEKYCFSLAASPLSTILLLEKKKKKKEGGGEKR